MIFWDPLLKLVVRSVPFADVFFLRASYRQVVVIKLHRVALVVVLNGTYLALVTILHQQGIASLVLINLQVSEVEIQARSSGVFTPQMLPLKIFLMSSLPLYLVLCLIIVYLHYVELLLVWVVFVFEDFIDLDLVFCTAGMLLS